MLKRSEFEVKKVAMDDLTEVAKTGMETKL